MNDPHRLLIIEASSAATPGLEELAESQEFFVTFVTSREPPESLARSVDEVIVTDTNDQRALVSRLETVRADGALTLLEWYVPATEAVRTALKLPRNGLRVAHACREKQLMRARLASAGVPVARQAAYASHNDVDPSVKMVGGLPCIIKPSDGTGSACVQLVATEAELFDAALRIESEDLNSRGQASSRQALVEEFIEGREFAVDTLSAGGRHRVVAIHEYELSPLPYFTDTAFFTPPNLTTTQASVVEDIAFRALDALGIVMGPSHCEVKLAESGPFVIEVAARYGGAHTPELVRATKGLRYVLAGARLACGSSDLPPVAAAHAGAVRHLYAPRAGHLKEIAGIESLRAAPGFVADYLDAGPRRVTPCIEDYRSRVGHVLFTGSTARQALARAADGASRLELRIEEEQSEG